jgi:two-component system NtrC family response regulator
MTPAFIERIQKNEWRGNIRELRNVIERSLIVCQGTELSMDNLPVELQYNAVKSNTLSAFDLLSIERLHIHRVLKYTKGIKPRLLNY